MRLYVRAALVVLALATAGPALAKELALVGGRIHPAPGVPALEDGVVLVRDGRIAAIGPRDAVALPPDAHRLDCRGHTVTAGFWNSHAHLSAWRMLAGGWLAAGLAEHELHEMFARFGFVHVLDAGSPFGTGVRLRERAASGALYPEIRTTRIGFVAPGGS